MSTPDFRSSFLVLFREAFEGVPAGATGTWFVQGKEGIFDALESVSAARASTKPAPDCPTIAAHTFHMLYALQGGNSNMGRPEPAGTWESSWDRQTATDEEWAELGRQIREEYEFVLKWMETNESWDNGNLITGPMGQLAHMSFHLGAIRALMKFV